MNKSYNILLAACLVGALFLFEAPGLKAGTFNSGSIQEEEAASAVFKKIEKGILSGKVSAISNLFNSQIYLSLSNGVNGYYSSNQAYYVLQGYFKNYRVVSFSIESIHNEDGNEVGTGDYSFSFKGKEERAQVYISLKKLGEKWKITQLTID